MSDRPPQHTPALQSGIVHEIRWSEICPWLILVRALRVTLLIRVLVLAALGVALTQIGWSLIHDWCSPELALPGELRADLPTLALSDEIQTGNKQSVLSTFRPERWQSGTAVSGWYWLTAPFVGIGNPGATWATTFGLALYGVWAIVVWALFGGAIGRIAAIYLTRGETLGPIVAMRDAVTTWLSTVGSPSIALLASIALAIPLVLLGTLLRLNLFAVVAGLLWCFALAWGLMLAVVLVGLLIGWPLMWSCLSVERSDAFDGVSRCYAYVYQRPLHLFFFVVFGALLGILGDTAVMFFANLSADISEWFVSWGMGTARSLDLLNNELASSPAPLATQSINAWKWCLTTLADSYPLACLWPMSVGTYLLLRRLIDATEMDEVSLPSNSEQQRITANNSE